MGHLQAETGQMSIIPMLNEILSQTGPYGVLFIVRKIRSIFYWAIELSNTIHV